MFPIQVRGVATRDEELTTVGPWSSIRHGELTRFGVLDDKILISKLLSVDGFATRSITICEIST